MSFNDMNNLEAQPAGGLLPDSTSTSGSPEFARLTRSISHNIFQITSNVSLIHRYIGLLRTPRDTEKMRHSLMDALRKTKDLTKAVIPLIAQLNTWPADQVGPPEKYEQQKLTGDFQKAAIDFQNAQKLALEKQKDYVKEARQTMEEEAGGEVVYEPDPDGRGERPRPAKGGSYLQDQARVQVLDDSDVGFNEQLIEERETEIQGIEQGIVELNEVFRQLGTIVTEQGYQLGNTPPTNPP
jgi:hypothetical protein